MFRHVEPQVSHDDVVSWIADAMRGKGFFIQTQVQVAGTYADVVAKKGNQVTLFEVKSYRPSSMLGYDSLAQVSRVAAGYRDLYEGPRVRPVLVGAFRVSDEVRQVASRYGVDVAPLEQLTQRGVSQALQTLFPDTPR